MTYSVLFQHNAPVSASFTPLPDGGSSCIPVKRGVIDLKLGALTTQITPSEARQLAADLMRTAHKYEAHCASLTETLTPANGEIEAYAAHPGT